MKMEQTECSETSAYKLQTPGNYPKESIQHTEHGESLKSRKTCLFVIEIRLKETVLAASFRFIYENLLPTSLYMIRICISSSLMFTLHSGP